jgi:superfamily I DNA/RNA helicase
LTLARDARREVPMLRFKAPGSSKVQPVTDAFFFLASFVENLSLDVPDVLLAPDLERTPGITGLELSYARATGHFWRHYCDVLKQSEVWTFNQLFAHFSENNPEALRTLSRASLLSMKHLMIDEFQDISPQIVFWVRGCQRELKRRGEPGSLMCIGDDWQSIYGWRGSSPLFFMNFESYFPAKSHDRIILDANFRSSQRVVNAAASILQTLETPSPVTKNPVAANPQYKDFGQPLQLIEYEEDLPVHRIRAAISTEVKRIAASKDNPVYVLVRGAKEKKALWSITKPYGDAVQLLTIHTSKGLEARSVIVAGECASWGLNPLKNYLYARAGLGSFDQSQRDEAKRLAYVAVTRAKEAAIWFAEPRDGGAFDSVTIDGVNAARTSLKKPKETS